jgi:multicomponent Na+:H+ antiporter subunit C
MTTSLALILAGATMIGCGVYLVLERSLTRVLVGLVMLGNGVNVLFLVASGPAGRAPIVDPGTGAAGTSAGGVRGLSGMADPLPEALVLTAIVISLATAAFILAMAYRSWLLTGHDDVQDDVEDRVIRSRATADEASDSFDLTSGTAQDDPSFDTAGPGGGPS